MMNETTRTIEPDITEIRRTEQMERNGVKRNARSETRNPSNGANGAKRSEAECAQWDGIGFELRIPDKIENNLNIIVGI